MIAMGSLCIIVILALSIFNSVQSRFFGLPMPAGSASTLISLAKYMNNKGISTIPGQANFDGSGFSYPADQLPHPGQVTLNGQQYLFPANAPGVNDNVVALGQTISIPPGHSYQQAFLLVAGSWGLLSSIVTVHYTDGSTVLASLSVPDWRVGPSGIVNTSYRYTPTDIDQGSVHIYAVQIELDPTKIVSSLTLPRIGQPGLAQPCLHIFALTLQS
jgi:alpha-L-fucosidase